MTVRDGFRSIGPYQGGNRNALKAEQDARYAKFIDRTVKRHPDLKGLKGSGDPQS